MTGFTAFAFGARPPDLAFAAASVSKCVRFAGIWDLSVLATKEVDCLLVELGRGFHLEDITVSVNHSGRGLSIQTIYIIHQYQLGFYQLLQLQYIYIYIHT